MQDEGAYTSVTAALLTWTIRYIPSEVILSPDEGPPSACAASLDNIVTIRQATLDRRITQLCRQKMLEVFEAIKHAFAMA